MMPRDLKDLLRAFNERNIDFAFPTRMIVERRAGDAIVAEGAG